MIELVVDSDLQKLIPPLDSEERRLLEESIVAVVDGFGQRDIQMMMFVEVKTWGADLRMAQRDTLHLLNQVLRNRRKNRHKNRDRYNAKNHAPPAEVYSPANEKYIKLFLFGGHVLTFEKNGPEDSSWIRWDKTDISTEQLVDLLKFELDPDDPTKKLDIRRRTGTPAKHEVLF